MSVVLQDEKAAVLTRLLRAYRECDEVQDPARVAEIDEALKSIWRCHCGRRAATNADGNPVPCSPRCADDLRRGLVPAACPNCALVRAELENYADTEFCALNEPDAHKCSCVAEIWRAVDTALNQTCAPAHTERNSNER